MNSAPSFVTPNQWSDYLARKELPLPSPAGLHILELLQDDDLPYNLLAQEINHDPVISFKVMTAANAQTRDEAPGSKTLDHAISMIGLNKLKELTRKVSAETAEQNQLTHEYLQAIMTSLLAAELARNMAEYRKPLLAEDIYWAALFHGVPHWYLGQFANAQVIQLESAIQKEFKPALQAQKAILGCTLRDVKQALTRQLNVPQLAKDCWNTNLQPSAREWVWLAKMAEQPSGYLLENHSLSIKLNHPVFPVLLANKLARYAMQDWYGIGTLRMQKVLAAYLGTSISHAIKQSHECAVEVSRKHTITDVLSPATRLFLPAVIKQKIRQENVAPAAKAIDPPPARPTVESRTAASEIPATPPIRKAANQTEVAPKPAPLPESVTRPAQTDALAPPRPKTLPADAPVSPDIKRIPSAPVATEATSKQRGNQALFDEMINTMLNHSDEFADMHELMNAASQGISYGLGLSRTLVLLVNTRQTRLKTFYHVGTRKKPELANLEIDLTRHTIFNKLMEKSASIWVKPDSSERIWSLVPASLKLTGGAKEFFLMSICVNRKPIAVFYADNEGGKGGGLTEDDYKYYKYLCTATAQCLSNMALNKDKPRQEDESML